jgi:hypothetical protein
MLEIGHHSIARAAGGSNHPINLFKTPKKPENNMHNHHWILLPHQKWLHDMDDWDSRVLCSEVKRRIHQVIDDIGPDMYLPEAVRDWTKIEGAFTRRKSGISVPIHYHD